MIDPTGALITTVRDALRVVFPQAEVRGGSDKGDPAPFVVIVRNMALRDTPAPGTATFRYIARCYGVDEAQASRVSGIVSDAVHRLGPRVVDRTGGDVGWYWSRDVISGQPDMDSDRELPLELVTIELITAAQAFG